MDPLRAAVSNKVAREEPDNPRIDRGARAPAGGLVGGLRIEVHGLEPAKHVFVNLFIFERHASHI